MILSRKTYWLLSLTWGIITTAVGLLVALVLCAFGFKSYKNMYGIVFEVGKGWGGFSAGPVSVICKEPSRYLLNHEFGHSVQNCFLGPLMIVLVIIPSVTRYWKIIADEKAGKPVPDYNAVWFEGTATTLGDLYYEALQIQG